MAPSTRSRNKPGVAQATKRPAEDSDIESLQDESSGEDVIKKKATGKPPAKRVKTARSGQGTATGKKRGGKLGAMPSMPLDILEEIFSLLNLTDLFSISRTTNAFRSLLLKDMQFRPLWAQAWARVEGYPACPSDVTLYTWLHLLFGGSYCHMCSASSVHRIHFTVRARICLNCVKANLLPHGSEYLRYTRHQVCDLIPAITLPSSKGGRVVHRYVFPDDYTTLKKGIEEAESKFKNWSESERAKNEYIEARHKEYLPHLRSVEICEQWQEERLGQHADDIEERRSKRRSDISRRLRLLDYTDNDIESIWKLKDVNVAKPLTDRSWNILLPSLQPTLDTQRSDRLIKEYDARYSRRFDAAREAWFTFMQSLAINPREFPYLPLPDQCASLDPISQLLGEDVEISEEWRERVQTACPEALIFARDVLAKRQMTAAGMAVANDKASLQALETGDLKPMQVLSRATSVFRTGYGSGDNRLRFGFEVLANAREQYYDSSRKYDNECIWHRETTTARHGKECVNIVLEHLGLGSETSMRELDRAEPIFICMTCPPEKRHWRKDDFLGRPAHGWRGMVLHLWHGHEGRLSDVQIRLITETERSELAAVALPTGEKYEASYAYGDYGKCWGCCHCTESMKSCKPQTGAIDYLMRRLTLDEHLRECHQIADPEEDVDYYWHPYFLRAGLLKGYGSGYKVRFEEDVIAVP